MGVHDREWWRDHQRRIQRATYNPREFRADPHARPFRPSRSRSMSTRLIVLLWILIGVTVFAVFQLRARRSAPQASTWSSAQPASPPSLSRSEVRADGPRPTTEAPRPLAVDTPTIYRCGNAYGPDPCAGGRLVDAPAASGFDSRPSEKLARLVAYGRTSDAGAPSSASGVVSTASGVPPPSSCEGYRQRVASIDRQAREPRGVEAQDRLRAERRHVRDLQLANRCVQ